MTMTQTRIVEAHRNGTCKSNGRHCDCSTAYAAAAEAPAKVERPAAIRERHIVAEADLLAFRANARHTGLTIVVSSPIGNEAYAVTTVR